MSYNAVAKMNTTGSSTPRFLLGRITWHRYCFNRGRNLITSYAPRKNLTHESTGGRVQSTSGQYSILSTTVSDGDTRNRYIIENGRFQLPRTIWFRGAHCSLIGGR